MTDDFDTPEGRTHHVGDDCPGGHRPEILVAWVPAAWERDIIASALAEDGECLAEHLCSSPSFVPHDMGVKENGWQRDRYAAKYPEGFTVRMVGRDDPQWQARMELNRLRLEAEDPNA